MKNTLSIHGTGNFLSWHRYYTFAYENALRVECGYNGTQPVSFSLGAEWVKRGTNAI
jgi:hypothetical protein